MIVSLSLVGGALAARPMLEIRIVDPDGESIPTAVLRFADEGIDLHRVPRAWSGDALWTPGGHELPLKRGMTVKLDAFAPGYALQQLEIEVDPRAPVEIELQRLPAPEDVDDPLERAALEAVQLWEAAAIELSQLLGRLDPQGIEALATAEYRARQDAIEPVEAWLRAAGAPPEAVALCRAVADHPSQCLARAWLDQAFAR